MTTRGAIIDLDGTVYRGETPVSGARRGIDALREAGYIPCFFSNNPTKSAAGFADRLAGMGFDVDPETIRSAATVTTDYLTREHPDDRVFLIGSSGLQSLFEQAGLALVEDPEACDVLVASYDRGFTYDDMTAGLRALEAGAAFVGTDPDVTIPTDDGRSVPGSGAIINAVAGVAEREPDIVVGKPSGEALDAALAALSDPDECLVVGDRLDTDIALGERGGLTTVLVRSGVTDGTTLAATSVEPDHVIDDLGGIGSVLDAL
jgi:4-nitrophenyl phosphatase